VEAIIGAEALGLEGAIHGLLRGTELLRRTAELLALEAVLAEVLLVAEAIRLHALHAHAAAHAARDQVPREGEGDEGALAVVIEDADAFAAHLHLVGIDQVVINLGGGELALGEDDVDIAAVVGLAGEDDIAAGGQAMGGLPVALL